MNEHEDTNRRTVLQTASVAGGIVLTGSIPVAAKNQNPGKDHKLDCEDGVYAKIEFVEEDEDCWFEEETDTDLVWVTDWTNKTDDGEEEECEPISVTLEYADGFTAAVAEVKAGGETYTFEDPGDTIQLDPDGKAISNIQFCIVQDQIFGSGEVAFGYEDLPKSESDWDVNDLVIDMNTSFEASGMSNGNPEVDQLTFDIIPQALGAGDDHEWRLDFSDSEICAGSYTLTTYDTSGNQVDQETGSVPGVITVFDSTQALFDESLSNAERPGDIDGCEKPNMWATLTVTFDSGCPLDIPTAPGDLNVNANDLFFGPVLYNKDEDLFVRRGDVRLVAVPDTWEWPLGAVQIWDAYIEVDEGSPDPIYTTSDWYNGGITDQDLVTNCNFEPASDNSIDSV